MSTDNLKKFSDLLKVKPELQARLTAVKNNKQKFLTLYIQIAKENGYGVSTDDLKPWMNSQLNEKQLEKIAAGVGDGCDPDFPRTCER